MVRRKVDWISIHHKAYTKEMGLISDIYESLGGLKAAAKKMGVSIQLAARWRDSGYVPLYRVVKIAAILGCKPEALNYAGVTEIQNKKVKFSELVKNWRA